jgi:bifunctional DNA-binding transcriptional regulator/antitoxin component of YhaV-PrlF toxin-antitoxin module
LVVPADVRERAGWEAGTPLVLIETDDSVVLLTRGQRRDRVRLELSGLDLVGELLRERRDGTHRGRDLRCSELD